MVVSPLSSASCFTSSTRTGMPALAKHMAMPPPMVPAPITAAERIGRAGVSSGTSGTLEAARSAKNTWRRALDSGELINSMNSLRSTCTPSSNVSSDAATASTHLSGAGYPFATAATLLRANCRKASGSGCATGENAARAARYAFLRQTAADTESAAIALGHTQDDQVETLLLHLLRGSGSKGLGAMRRREDDLAGPLLDILREDIEAYLARLHLMPIRDPTNDDPRFTRNRLRQQLMPAIDAFDPA